MSLFRYLVQADYAVVYAVSNHDGGRHDTRGYKGGVREFLEFACILCVR